MLATTNVPATVVPPFLLLLSTNAKSRLDVLMGLLNLVSPRKFNCSVVVPTLIFPSIIEIVAGMAPYGAMLNI